MNSLVWVWFPKQMSRCEGNLLSSGFPYITLFMWSSQLPKKLSCTATFLLKHFSFHQFIHLQILIRYNFIGESVSSSLVIENVEFAPVNLAKSANPLASLTLVQEYLCQVLLFIPFIPLWKSLNVSAISAKYHVII